MSDEKDIVRIHLPRETWRLLERLLASTARIDPKLVIWHTQKEVLERWGESPFAVNAALADFIAALHGAGILVKSHTPVSSSDLRKAGRGL